MDERSRVALELLRRDDKSSWVREQLVDSFSEGITQSASDRDAILEASVSSSDPAELEKERSKRKRYETSRPYNEEEKIDLIRYALHEVYVTIPEIQIATARALRELGHTATAIEFSAPDDEERPDASYAFEIDLAQSRADDLKHRYTEFINKLT